MNWVVLIGLAGVFQGVCNFAFRQMAVATASVYALAAFFVISGLMFLGYAAAMKHTDLTREAWMWVGVLVVTIFASNVLLMKGFGTGVVPVGMGYLVFYILSLIVLLMLGVFVLGEKLNAYGWAGLVSGVVAIVLLMHGRD